MSKIINSNLNCIKKTSKTSLFVISFTTLFIDISNFVD